MKAKNIRKQVELGNTVHWKNSNYQVIKDNIGQWLLHSKCNDWYFGIFDKNGQLDKNDTGYYVVKN